MLLYCNGLVFDREDAAKYLSHRDKSIAQLARIVVNWDAGQVSPMISSGSSGHPTEIVHSKAYIKWLANQTKEHMQLEKHELALCTLPLDKAGGLMMVLRSLQFDWNIICVDPMANPLRNLDIEPSFVALSPYQLQAVLKHKMSFEKLKHIQHILLGGMAIQDAALQKMRYWENPVWLGYGMTETAGHIALRDVRTEDAYTPFNGVGFEAGEFIKIHIPEFNVHVQTNDLGFVQNGKLFITGRNLELINSGGIKLMAGSLESTLQSAVSAMGMDIDIAVFGVDHKSLGQKILIAYTGKLSDENMLQLNHIIGQHHGKYAIPAAWHAIGEIPRLQFKPDRKKLAEMFSDLRN